MFPKRIHPFHRLAVPVRSLPGHPVPGQVQGGHHEIGRGGGAIHRTHPPQLVHGQAVGQQQGGLPHGGEGLVGGHHHQVRRLVPPVAQEGQVGAVGAVHHQSGPMGVAHPGNGGQI